MSVYIDQKVLCIYVYLHNKEKLFSILSNSIVNLFRINLTKDGPTCRDKWLIHGPKHHKDNQSHSLKHRCRMSQMGCNTVQGVPEQRVQSGVLKGPRTSHAWEGCYCGHISMTYLQCVNHFKSLAHGNEEIKAIIWYRTICAWKRQTTIASIRHGFN